MQSIAPRLDLSGMQPSAPPPHPPDAPDRPIVLRLDEDAKQAGWIQPFAGGRLWSGQPIGVGAVRAPRPPIRSAAAAQAAWSVIYDGPGLVDGGLYRLRSFLSAEGERRVDFADGESFLVDPAGGFIERRSSGPATARSLERALGAPMALALALRGVHLLHASAVARLSADGVPGNAIAFTATSGAGKSTLAAAAGPRARAGGGTLVRIADDQLPVRLGSQPEALPHFPQLKLPPTAGYPATAPVRLAFERLVEIEHSTEVRAIAIERLSPAAACLALARATVAAKLFDPDLLQRHFDACAAAGKELPVHRLVFPTGLEHLPAVLAAIAELQL